MSLPAIIGVLCAFQALGSLIRSNAHQRFTLIVLHELKLSAIFLSLLHQQVQRQRPTEDVGLREPL